MKITRFHKLAAVLTLALLLASCSATTGTTSDSVETDDPYALPESSDRVVVSADNDEENGITTSVPAGIYTTDDAPEYVTLSTDTGYVIRYTTSTAVTPTSISQEATKEIRLPYNDTGDGKSEFAIIRAALFDGSEQVGQTYSFTFLRAPEGRFTSPVYLITSDPTGLYGYEEGILVEGKARDDAEKYGNPDGWVLGNKNANYYNQGREWEREITLEYSENGIGAFDFVQNGGVRVSGCYTRCNTQKSLKLFARKDYTPSTGVFAFEMFPGLRITDTGNTVNWQKTLVLRGGSNNEGNTIIQTPFQLALCSGTHQLIPATRPVTEFINGEYRGMFMLIEDYDVDFFMTHYGIEEDEVTIINGSYENYGGSMWTIDNGTDEDVRTWIKLLMKISSLDMSKKSNYENICEKIDMQNFIEYMCLELYFGNSDWPDNNVRVAKYCGDDADLSNEGFKDGRYRFLLKDLDLSFGYGHSVSNDPYNTLTGGSALELKEAWQSLMKNEEFSDLVYTYMSTIMNCVVTEERVDSVISEFVTAMKDEMAFSTSKLHVAYGSEKAWENGLKVLTQYADSRPKMVKKYTEKSSGEKYASVNIWTAGEGTVEVGWFEAYNGENRSYLKNTRIPIDLSTEADIKVVGGYYEDGYVIITDSAAAIGITFRASSSDTSSNTGVVINEVSRTGYDYEFIELYNNSDSDIDLSDWSIGTRTDEKLTGMTIKAHGYFLIANTDNRDAALKFTFSSSDTLVLKHGDTIVDEFDLSSLSKSVQYGRYPDGGEMVTLYTSELTPGAANRIGDEYSMNQENDE